MRERPCSSSRSPSRHPRRVDAIQDSSPKLLTRQKTDIMLKGGESLDAADFERRGIKLMYVDTELMHLLDQADYNQ